jgi:hypothetical protein
MHGDELLIATVPVLSLIGVFTSFVNKYYLIWMMALLLGWKTNISGVIIINNIAP